MLQERPVNNFGIAFFITATITLATGIVILMFGKHGTFQLVNSHHNSFSDHFFKYFTHYGDGLVWGLLALFCFFYRKKYLVAVIAGVVISTLIAQFLKRIVFPDELRPITFLAENFPIHIVDGVTMRRQHSFPSGHSTTAFTMALVMAYMINRKIWSVILPLLAFLAAYSRVYLAQHFPTDAFAGMCIGIVSAISSLLIYRAFAQDLNKKVAPDSGTTSSA